MKLYTQEGNWDIVGNNIPVFFIQDAIKFPDVIHAVKPEPDREFPQAQSAHDNFWDFVSLMPESTHMLLWVMSDRAIPRSFRFMEGFGVHTFRFVNARGRSRFVKFHWKPKQGMQSVLWDEAVKINGADPDFHRRDLWNAINSGDLPEWELCVQVFDDAFADKFEFDVLDPTKLIPEEVLPVRPIARLVLDRMVDNFFAETEQVAFCTQNIVPGVDFTNDPLLQGRNFSYLDTQVKRLGGPNFTHIPVNAPKCPMAHFQQDGHMAMMNPQGRVNFEPNSYTGAERGPREDPDRRVRVVRGRRGRPEAQAARRELRRPLQPGGPLLPQSDRCRATAHRRRIHVRAEQGGEPGHPRANGREPAQRGRGPRRPGRIGLGMAMLPPASRAAAEPNRSLKPSAKLSILANGPSSFAGRKVGVLVTDGAPAKAVKALAAAVKAEKATLEVIAPTITGVALDDGSHLLAQQMVGGGPSVLYDAVAVITSDGGAAALAELPAAKDFVTDAHSHKKVIGYVGAAATLFAAAGLGETMDVGYCDIATPAGAKQFVASCRALRVWERP